MKNIFTVTLLSIFAILLATACSKEQETPADIVQKLDPAIMQKQADFDQKMIEKSK